MSRVRILTGDCREMMATLPAGAAQCCVTSPPYYGLRDYGVDGQIGLEQTPDAYVAELVEVFRGVRRVLREDGTLWLNLGDSYNNATSGNMNGTGPSGLKRDGRPEEGRRRANAAFGDAMGGMKLRRALAPCCKPKDLLGIPWRVAFALQADGWYLRSAIVWHKPNPMPESCKDRPTSAYEHVFLFAKAPTYFYDADAIRERAAGVTGGAPKKCATAAIEAGIGSQAGLKAGWPGSEYRNARNVWTIVPRPFKGAHFATMPIDLAERCIKAGSKHGDTVLDPFGGAATTGVAAVNLGRRAVLTELNPEYVAIARARVDEAEAADAAEVLRLCA